MEICNNVEYEVYKLEDLTMEKLLEDKDAYYWIDFRVVVTKAMVQDAQEDNDFEYLEESTCDEACF